MIILSNAKTWWIIGLVVLVATLGLLAANRGSPVHADPHTPQSVNVAIIDGPVVINGGTFPTGAPFVAFSFTNLPVANVNTANLAPFDTVLLNVASTGMNCNTNSLSPQAKTDLVTFVGAGNKLIISDSECNPGPDYSWLPFPFTTNNPGPQGAVGVLIIVEDNTLSHNTTTDSHFIDANLTATSTDAVGDMNVMVTRDPNWCLDMEGTNITPVTGAVHAYADYSPNAAVGLFIWNGLDMDQIGSTPNTTSGPGNIAKIWLQELQQPFNPSGLPCGIRVAPARVGGTTSFLVNGSNPPAQLTEGSRQSAGSIAILAGGLAAAAVVVLGTGTWYARRRWLRHRS